MKWKELQQTKEKIKQELQSAQAEAEYNKRFQQDQEFREAEMALMQQMEIESKKECGEDAEPYKFEIVEAYRKKYETALMLGEHSLAKEIQIQAKEKERIVLGDCSSKTGIPDCVAAFPVAVDALFSDEEIAKHLTSGGEIYAGWLSADVERWKRIPASRRQALSGSCNDRELGAVMKATALCDFNTTGEFVSKATLYMARFINRWSRNDEGHPYTPGEAYLFMEHGEAMQDAFTPDEVKLAMDKADISASQAVTLIKELERLRDERKNPEA